MYRLGEYVVSLTAVSLISAILLSLLRDGPERKILRLVCGVLTAMIALAPIYEVLQLKWDSSFASYMEEGKKMAENGEYSASAERTRYIRESLEAYIYEKAEQLNLDLTVNLIQDETGHPYSVEINGAVSDSDREKLRQMIVEDLGIPKENQQWNG